MILFSFLIIYFSFILLVHINNALANKTRTNKHVQSNVNKSEKIKQKIIE